jgi:hypothetical protein
MFESQAVAGSKSSPRIWAALAAAASVFLLILLIIVIIPPECSQDRQLFSMFLEAYPGKLKLD